MTLYYLTTKILFLFYEIYDLKIKNDILKNGKANKIKFLDNIIFIKKFCIFVQMWFWFLTLKIKFLIIYVYQVVVVGVSEEALRKRLPQLAWGLARHGGPSAAQLARIAMLRLRPALLLEQLLQPQCLNARNAKVRFFYYFLLFLLIFFLFSYMYLFDITDQRKLLTIVNFFVDNISKYGI